MLHDVKVPCGGTSLRYSSETKLSGFFPAELVRALSSFVFPRYLWLGQRPTPGNDWQTLGPKCHKWGMMDIKASARCCMRVLWASLHRSGWLCVHMLMFSPSLWFWGSNDTCKSGIRQKSKGQDLALPGLPGSEIKTESAFIAKVWLYKAFLASDLTWCLPILGPRLSGPVHCAEGHEDHLAQRNMLPSASRKGKREGKAPQIYPSGTWQ